MSRLNPQLTALRSVPVANSQHGNSNLSAQTKCPIYPHVVATPLLHTHSHTPSTNQEHPLQTASQAPVYITRHQKKSMNNSIESDIFTSALRRRAAETHDRSRCQLRRLHSNGSGTTAAEKTHIMSQEL